MTRLVLVESGAKAGKIKRYLQDFETQQGTKRRIEVKATFGHVRDLPSHNLGIDVENDFSLHYAVLKKSKDVVKDLRKCISNVLKRGGDVILAADPDREGEAIAQSVVELFELDPERTPRMTFTEITKPAIIRAYQSMKTINQPMVQAQETRRAVDRLLGWRLSPLLWKAFPGLRHLSAGRTQSVVLKQACVREDEIHAFDPTSFFQLILGINFNADDESVRATFHCNDTRPPTHILTDAPGARSLVAETTKHELVITALKRRVVRKTAPERFMTATLQQESRKRLGMTIKETQPTAQQLYQRGLITYIRTDTTACSKVFQNTLLVWLKQRLKPTRRWIKPTKRSSSKQRSKEPQQTKGEAHECIRPTDVTVYGEDHASLTGLTSGQRRLYRLIWQRTVQSMLQDQTFDQLEIHINSGSKHMVLCQGMFRAQVLRETFPGWTVVQRADPDAWMTVNVSGEKFPVLKVKQTIHKPDGEDTSMKNVTAQKSYTKPPVRFNDATMVQAMQRLGIGRPSTFVPSVQRNLDRKYLECKTTEVVGSAVVRFTATKHNQWEINFSTDVQKIKHRDRLVPTILGRKVNQYLQQHFSHHIDEQYTADLESQLDEIANGKKQRIPVLRRFYQDLEHQVKQAETGTIPEPAPQDRIVGTHDGKVVSVRTARYGPVLQWSGKYFKLDGEPDTIAKDQAMQQFHTALNRPKPTTLGQYRRKPVLLCQGPHGWYIRRGKACWSADQNTTFEQAKELMREKKK